MRNTKRLRLQLYKGALTHLRERTELCIYHAILKEVGIILNIPYNTDTEYSIHTWFNRHNISNY